MWMVRDHQAFDTGGSLLGSMIYNNPTYDGTTYRP